MDGHTLTKLDFESLWGEPLSAWVVDRLERRDLRYAVLAAEQRDQVLLEIMGVLLGETPRAGKHRSSDWESGWTENLTLYVASGDDRALVPRYFNKNPVVRWRQELVRSESPTLEFDLFATLLDWVLDTRVPDHTKALYEFGCGTGHNLLRARERFPRAKITGLDWATSSQEAIRALSRAHDDEHMGAQHFDFFNPDTSLDLDSSSAVLTVAALEQVGSGFSPFLDYLCGQRPTAVVHIEPIRELLDPENLMDFLSIEYFKKRDYLDGYLTELRRRETIGEVEILEARRTFVGSLFIDGYSLIVWRPIDGA